jgi:branched-chain amino acid transport system permease protein
MVVPALPVGATFLLFSKDMPMALEIGLTAALVLPIGPLLYRLVFQPIASASILVLLMVAVALHFALNGMALLYFGPEGLRTDPYTSGAVDLAGMAISTQTILIVAAAIFFSATLYLFFEYTIMGKALRATAINRVGARLVGIRTTYSGSFSFLLATAIAIVSGILISPVTTIYYDTGFLVGLKGFVGSVVGGFVSYPLAAVGALLIGLIEAYASFYASSLKDAIVFAAIIPVVIWRWLATHQHDEAEEEEEAKA